MTWVNYNNFQSWIFGDHSMISSQIAWLHEDFSSLEGNPYLVMFYHYDFGWYEDAPQMPQFFSQYGVNLALWGHTHNEATYHDGPTLSLNTAAAMSSFGGFRLLKFEDGQLVAHPHLWNQDDITLEFALPNDGSSPSNSATVSNTHNVDFEHAMVRFCVPAPEPYHVDGGEIFQVIDAGGSLIYEVELEVLANDQAEVSITPQTGAEGTQVSKGIERFALYQNSPNPFNPDTNISFHLPGEELQRVVLKIYNVRGQMAVTLMDQHLSPGRHNILWDGRDGRGCPLASGLYFCQLRAGDDTKTMKMILLR
jgi:hypothetical protein